MTRTDDMAAAAEANRAPAVTGCNASATAGEIATAATCDAFLGGAVLIHQPAKGYRAGLDAVLLAAAVTAPPRGRPWRLLDVGAGVGVVGLCAAVRLAEADVTLVERSPELCGFAATNIGENGLSERISIVKQDVTRPDHGQFFGAMAGAPADNSFDVVVSNPPYYDDSRHRQSPHALKAASHAMPDDGLDAWLRYMARMTKSGGTALMIHRADELPAMLQAFGRRFGALTVLPLYPRAGEAASRVILRGRKGSRAPLRLLPGLALHGPDNRFTPDVDKVLKTPAPLAFEADA